MNYRENIEDSAIYRQEYRDGIMKLLQERQNDAAKRRREYFKDIFSDSERYRRELAEMLGWPLVGHTPDGLPRVETVKLADEGVYEIFRMRFEILDGLVLTGLFFKLRGEEKRPLVIVQHGGQGTPEHISGFEGHTSNYNDVLWRIVNKGVHGFAPQLLLWKDVYFCSQPNDRKSIDARLKRVGSSISAVEIYGIKRILDYFEKESFVSSLGMVGVSYGGFYTLFTAALDTRIKAAITCVFFNNRDSVGWSDWVWQNSAEKFDDAEVACLVYPRKLDIQIGDKDPGFSYEGGVKSYEEICRICETVGTDWVNFRVFDGTHEFFKDDEPIEKLVEELTK